MKKKLFGILAIFFVSSILGQEQESQVDPVASNVFYTLRSLPARSVSFGKKLLDFEKAVNYLKGARDCLSGIGCSKRRSYLANYLLGATYGFAQSAAFIALANSNPGLQTYLFYITILINELGYRYLVKEPVSLFRCLTFRGCTDQTKRYLFYNAGLTSGSTGATLADMGRVWAQQAQQERQQQMYIEIKDNAIKKELSLPTNKNTFPWYEVLGFEKAPSSANARKAYRKLSLKYHPDKTKKDLQLSAEIQKVLNDAKERIK